MLGTTPTPAIPKNRKNTTAAAWSRASRFYPFIRHTRPLHHDQYNWHTYPSFITQSHNSHNNTTAARESVRANHHTA